MALTAERKEANRLERLARDAAWKARCRERDEAERDARAKVDLAWAPQIERLSAMERTVDAEGDEAVRAIDAQLAELRSRRDEAVNVFDVQIDALQLRREECVRDARTKTQAAGAPVLDALDAKDEEYGRIETELAERFPDLRGRARWSSVAWAENRNRPVSVEDQTARQ